jgi:uncharacterized DUF497 family protein
MGSVFRWDPEKPRSNLRKHGVTFDEAASVFRDALSSTIADPLHSTRKVDSSPLGGLIGIERWS